MDKYMKVAKELSEENLQTNDGGPFGACVVKDGEIIGKGSNKVLGNNDPTAHAEIVAIREACKHIGSHDLSGCELYTTCYPCPMCTSAIIWANIKNVYYGNTTKDASNIGFRDEYIYEFIKKLDNNENIEEYSFKCIDREETLEVFNKYAEMNNKNKY